MKKRLLYLLLFYLLTVLLFVAAKVVFMVCNSSGHPFTAGDVCAVIGHGLSLDLSTALYFLILPFLLTFASLWVRVPRWAFLVYYAVISVAFALAFVADTSLYAFWQFKLDASCLGYLATPTEAMASVTTTYLAVRLLVLTLVAAAIYLLYRRLSPLPSHLSPLTSPLPSLVCLLMIPLMVIGIRGGLDESTTNIGQVYYSQNQFLNHSAVNPVFSFLYSLGKSGNYIVAYNFLDQQECDRLMEGVWPTQTVDADSLLNTPRPNILLIVMESCGGQFTAIGGQQDITPNLNRLMHEGVFFTQCYANSWRTDKGVVSILSGYPAFPITSVMKVPEKSRRLPSIAASLKQEGYENSFFYGGDINFTNMRSYVMSSGYDNLTWKRDFTREEQQTAKWGVRDEIMFQAVLDDIKSRKTPHWMTTLLTLSSHEPWDVPTHQLSDEVYNAFNYLDQCIGNFISQLRQMPEWNDLLVIILPDHGYRYKNINETTLLFNHIPMIWVGGAVRKTQTVNQICNQSDLAATLLGQMGIAHEQFAFSRDVLSATYRRPVAFHTYVDGVTVIDSTGFMSYDMEAGQVIGREGNDTDRLLQLGRAMLQLTSKDLTDK